jgi:hypothetical protein
VQRRRRRLRTVGRDSPPRYDEGAEFQCTFRPLRSTQYVYSKIRNTYEGHSVDGWTLMSLLMHRFLPTVGSTRT